MLPESLKVLPVKSTVWYSRINNVTIKNDLNVPGNARRHSIAITGSGGYSLRFTSWGMLFRAASGQQDGICVLKYDDIGSVLYEPFTIVVTTTATDAAIIETYTEERPGE